MVACGILSMTIRGLISNLAELRLVLHKYKPDICVTMETHVTDEIMDNEIKMGRQYRIIRTNSSSNRTGGTVVFVNKKLKVTNVLCSSTNYIWLSAFDITTQDHELIKIVAVYMSACHSKAVILDYIFRKMVGREIVKCVMQLYAGILILT